MKTIRNGFFGEDVEMRKHPIYDVYCFDDGSVQAIPHNPTYNTERLYSPSGDTHKYYSIRVYINDRRVPKVIHRMIAETFIPNPENLPCVDHINRNTHDNRVSNLRWVSYETNGNNTSRQVNAKTDKSHQSHVQSCKKWYRNKINNGFIRKRIKENGKVIHRWFKQSEFH